MTRTPAIFLDRDGVIIEDAHYVGTPERARLLPGAAEAIAALNRAGWPVVVVTNQAGVAKGLFPAAAVDHVHAHLATQLATFGAVVAGFYFCPHHPDGVVDEFSLACECRKPQPGMLYRAAAEHRIDLTGSWMVGDRVSDLEAGAAAGCRTILVRTGYGGLVDTTTLDRETLNLELIAADLADAVAKTGLAERRKQVA